MLINYKEEYFMGGDVEMIINILTAVKMSAFCTKKPPRIFFSACFHGSNNIV